MNQNKIYLKTLLFILFSISTILQIECCFLAPIAAAEAGTLATTAVVAAGAGVMGLGITCDALSPRGRKKRTIANNNETAILNETWILLNTTIDVRLAMANRENDPNNMDAFVNNITLNAFGVTQIKYGNISNKLQILFVLPARLQQNPSIVGAEVSCAGSTKSIVLKSPNDNNGISTTTPKPSSDPWCWCPPSHRWCWWKLHKKHQKHQCRPWWGDSSESDETSYEFSGEYIHEHWWQEAGPKSHVMHGRHRRQAAALPTATSLLVVIGLPIPFDITMAYYDPVRVQNDTDYMVTQLFLTAMGLSTKTYLEDNAANQQIQFYFSNGSNLCCSAIKKAQNIMDSIDPFYEFTANVYCGLEKPVQFKPQTPSRSICLCSPDWTYFNGSCYLLNTNITGLSFSQAESYCQTNYNAHLPSVHSVNEQNFIGSLLEKALNASDGVKRIWNGMMLQRNATIYGASWIDGSPVDFGNPVGITPGTFPWGIHPTSGPEPQNVPTETRVVMVMRSGRAAGLWADIVPSTPTHGLLCRK